MGAIEVLSCLVLAFAPALSIFCVFIAADPLRIILFALGAFFWLLSLLVSAFIWFVVQEILVPALFISIFVQELFRLLYFVLLKHAQRGLSMLAMHGMHISGVHSLQNARHTLAIVCGLGMGVMAALFMLINVLADFWGPGTIGLPASIAATVNGTTPGTIGLPASIASTINGTTPAVIRNDFTFSLTSTLSASILVMCHMFWTVIFWDGCHRRPYYRLWWTNLLLVLVSHCAISALSFLNGRGDQWTAISLQFCVLLINAFIAYFVMGGSWLRLKAFAGFAPPMTIDNRISEHHVRT